MIKFKSYLAEIYRKDAGEYSGGKEDLKDLKLPAGLRKTKLAGHEGLTYAVDKYDSNVDIYIMNKNTCIGAASLENISSKLSKEIKLPYRMNAITVDEDYRGKGIARALYEIVLNVLRGTLVSGEEQTPGGRKNWINLMKIPGITIQGVFAISDTETKSEENIDAIMALGLQYLGKLKTVHFFAYDVTSGKTEIEPIIKTQLNKIYHDKLNSRREFLIAFKQ